MKLRWISISLAVAVVGGIIYYISRSPDGLEPMGQSEESLAFYGALAGIAGAVSALLGLLKELVVFVRETRSSR